MCPSDPDFTFLENSSISQTLGSKIPPLLSHDPLPSPLSWLMNAFLLAIRMDVETQGLGETKAGHRWLEFQAKSPRKIPRTFSENSQSICCSKQFCLHLIFKLMDLTKRKPHTLLEMCSFKVFSFFNLLHKIFLSWQ